MLQGPSVRLNSSVPREDLGSQCHSDGPVSQLDPTLSMLQQQMHTSLRPLEWAQAPGFPTAAAPIETGATLPYREFSQSAKPGTQNGLPYQACYSITSGGQRAQDKQLQPQTSSSLLPQSSAPRSESQTQPPPSNAQLQSVLHFPKHPRVQVVSAGFGASLSTASALSANHTEHPPVNHSSAVPALYALEKQHGNHYAAQAVSSLTQRHPPTVTPGSPSQAPQVPVQPAMLSPFASYSLRPQECNAAAAAAAAAALRDPSSPLTDPSIGPSTSGSSEPVNLTAKGCSAQPPLLPSVKTGVENQDKVLKYSAEADIDSGKYLPLQQGRQNSASLSQASAQDPQATCSDSAASDGGLRAEKRGRSAELMDDLVEDSPSASKNMKEEVVSRPSLDAAAVERRRLRRRVTNRESAKRIRSKREEEMQAMHTQVAQLEGHKTALVAHLTTVEDSCARYIQELKALKASWCRTCIENVKLYKRIFELQKALNPGTPDSMLASLLGLPPQASQPPAAAGEPSSSLLQHDNPPPPAPAAAAGENVAGCDGMYAGSR